MCSAPHAHSSIRIAHGRNIHHYTTLPPPAPPPPPLTLMMFGAQFLRTWVLFSVRCGGGCPHIARMRWPPNRMQYIIRCVQFIMVFRFEGLSSTAQQHKFVVEPSSDLRICFVRVIASSTHLKLHGINALRAPDTNRNMQMHSNGGEGAFSPRRDARRK